jgi:Na+-driven multidrug efflux pump
MLNELFWALGITTYFAIYARISTESVAAMNIVSTLEGVAIVAFIGLGNATAILVGNRIGAGETERAHRYAGHSLALAVAGGILVGGFILLLTEVILSFYKVPPEVILYARRAMLVLASFLWLRASNIILFIGVLRAGGDTRMAFILDAVIIWVVGVPLAYFGAFVLQLPVYLVYLLVMTEELLKCVIAMLRYNSRRWIHDLTRVVS